MKVREIMINNVHSIKPSISALEALGQLKSLQISGLPVLDEQRKLLGMFTEKEILSFILPSYLQNVGKFIYEESPKSVKEKISKLKDMTVEQLMRKDVITINEDATLGEVARLMLTQKARRIPVLNQQGVVVGIISRCDCLEALIQESGIKVK